MSKVRKILTSLLLILSLCLIVGCNNEKKPTGGNENPEFVDYVSQIKLEQSFEGKLFVRDGIEEVTLLQAVDGDTIHVTDKNGTILKLRFLGVDTPESTASVEPWGMAASSFTKNAVKNCESLVITADNGEVELDSYGRHLAWVWYKAQGATDYTLLNLQLAQEGYSLANYSNVKQYKDEIKGAINQAQKQQIHVWAPGQSDPDYCYTEATEVSLPELKRDIIANGHNSKYFNKKVIFTANVVRKTGTTYYLNETDYEEGITYGIQVFHRTSTGILDVIGTRVKISGTITYYDAAGVYQLTDVIDRLMTTNKNNLKVIEENVELIPTVTEIADINASNNVIEFTLVELKNLVVTSVYTTRTEGSSSYGAISVTCKAGDKTIVVRTTVLVDRSGKYEVDSNDIVLESNFVGKTIDVIGVLEKYEGNYQLKLVSMDDVVFH